MASQPLPSRDDLRKALSYVPETGELFWHPRPPSDFSCDRIWRMWCTKNLGHRAGYTIPYIGTRYWMISFYQRQVSQHRLIWKWMTGEEVSMIDHKDLDGLNNAWTNLRPATKAQNARNSVVHRDKRSGLPKGVWQRRRRFIAEIVCDRVRTRLGSYPTVEEAHAAYCEAAQRLHGEFWRG